MPTVVALLGTAGFVAPSCAVARARRLTSRRARHRRRASRAPSSPRGAWTLAEWLRGYIFTGFPWLAVGYAQLPGSALAGYAPLGGVFLVSLAVALVGGDGRARVRRRCRALVPRAWSSPPPPPSRCSSVAASPDGSNGRARGQAARGVARAGQRAAGAQVRSAVSRDRRSRSTPNWSSRAAAACRAARKRVPDVLRRSARRRDPSPDPHGERARRRRAARPVHRGSAARRAATEPRYYNSVVALGDERPAALSQASPRAVRRDDSRSSRCSAGSSATCSRSRSRTRRPGPRSNRRSPSPDRRVAVNICYEDAFGGELIDGAARRGAARQRDQRRVVRPLDRRLPAQPDRRDARARDRAADAARDQHRHHVGDRARRAASSPSCRGSRAASSEITIDGRTGATPYQRFGDGPTLALAAALVALAAWSARRRI